jgi:hypothetical protein
MRHTQFLITLKKKEMKKFALICVLIVATAFSAMAQQKEFLENLRAYCGKSFEGKPIFPAENNPFGDERLIVIFSSCNENEIRMPFHVGNDKSRTWILTLNEEGLLFKHDHRHDDGTPDEVTNYGGWASGDGNEWVQFFPADQFTKDLIPYAATNEWSFVIDTENKVLKYVLKRDGNMRFQADFDLSKPIN